MIPRFHYADASIRLRRAAAASRLRHVADAIRHRHVFFLRHAMFAVTAI